MAHSVYVTTSEASGKSLVVLGLMELLSHRVHRLGFFRPIIRGGESPDNDIELMRKQYALTQSYAASFCATYEAARQLLAEGRKDDLLKNILSSFRTLQEQCDFVVCEGTDFTGTANAFEFDFNAEVARHLGCSVVIVANGQQKTDAQLIETLAAARRAYLDQRCTVAATIVNRIPWETFAATKARLKQEWEEEDPVFAIPEEPVLASPTLLEIARDLGAEILYAGGGNLQRDALNYRIAAMQLQHFLGYVENGSLIIVPGDRSDIVLGCLATTLSEEYPRIAGLVLTGGLALEPQIRRLIEGIRHPPVPILSVNCDTFTAAMRIQAIRAEIAPDDTRKIAKALGAFESHVNVPRLERQLEVTRSVAVTPLMFEYDLIARAKARRQHIVLPEGKEERILRAAEILLHRNVVEITLLGDEAQIRSRIAALGLSLDAAHIVNPATSAWREDFARTYAELRKHKGLTFEVAADVMLDVSYFGTMMVHQGLADGMVSGSVHTTAHTIRPAFEIIKTRPGCAIVSSVMLMCLADRVLVYGDCAINPNPNAEQLADIAISSATTAAMFGIEPRVAMLSYSTGESGAGQDVDTVRAAARLARAARPDLKIEGPIQYDAAIDASVARTKLPHSEVAGRATVFIFPDLNTGNNTYKAVQRSAGAVAIGPVLQGLKKPVNDLSRGCTVTDIVNTVAITAIQAQLLK